MIEGSDPNLGGVSSSWFKLTPDQTGSYIKGTWTTLSSMGTPRLYFASNVLQSGNVFVQGGEYSGSSGAQNDVNTGEIYNPTTDTWTPISTFPQSNFGDDPSMLLDNGQVLTGYLAGPQTYFYDPSTDTWTQAATKLNNDPSDEEGWIKLATGNILSYDVISSVNNNNSTAQFYNPTTNTWTATQNVPDMLSSVAQGYELGPGLLLPNGNAFYTGGNSNTAIYNPTTDTWTAGPVIPNNMAADDAPGAMLPTGQVMFAADSPPPTFNAPTQLVLYDPNSNTISAVTSEPAALSNDLSQVGSYTTRMLVLPNGQMLFEDGADNTLWVYTPAGTTSTAVPVVQNVTNNGGGNYTLTGLQLNGQSAGATYGDDVEMDENYPIVYFKDSSGNIYYATTSNWSTTGVQTGSTVETVNFTIPNNLPKTTLSLYVSGAGLSSTAFSFGNSGVTVSGEAFVDTNGNGTLDSGEPGFGGVTVQLLDSSNNVVQTTTSAADGTFTFTNVAPGTYTVNDVPPSDWLVDATATVTVTTSSVSGALVGNFHLVSVSGEVFNDLNGNGSKDPGDPGLQNWTVDLLSSTGSIVSQTTTDANGNYQFINVVAGTYTVQEVLQSGWQQTFPSLPGTYTVVATSGLAVTADNFGNFLPVTVSGIAFNDLNGNGTRDSGEPGLQGWTINLLNAGNSVIATTTTNSTGQYSFANVGPGTFTIQEILQAGWTQTFPAAPGTHSITASSGINISSGEDFGDFQLTSVSGEVFNDINGNGAKDPLEPGLSNWTVQLLNSSGNLLSSTTSDSNGNYTFNNIGPGTFTVKEVLQSGWFLTVPSGSGTYTISPTSGTPTTSENFGDFLSATVTGEVFNDRNGNGNLDNGEPGLQGWTVKLFDSKNNLVNTSTTDANGNYILTGVGPGSYTVSEVLLTGWAQTFPAPPGNHAVSATSGGLLSGQNFGNFQKTAISGQVFADINDTGGFVAGDPGIQGWTVQLLNPSTGALLATAITDANGNYTFSVGAGTFRLREIVPTGWVQTTPNPSDVSSISGLPTTGIVFGNFQLAVISGETFQDFSGNGLLNGNDTPLQGWTVQILDPTTENILNSQVTGANGTFSMVAGGPGTYRIREVNQNSWLQTTSNPLDIVVTQSGTVVIGQNFGNFHYATASGQVFLDQNGDGVKNGSDSGLQGWTIDLLNASTGALQSFTTTDANGNYSFTNLGPGAFRFREVVQSGWTQTSANPVDITTTSGGNTTGVSFGDFLLGTISGEAFQDNNGDGAFNGSDSGVPNRTIQLLNASNGTVLQTQTTSSQGTYQFSALGPGTYLVSEVLPAGWLQTTANPAAITISSGSTQTGINFGTFQLVSISGRVFIDSTADGVDSPSKLGFNGFTIQLYHDANGTGQLVLGTDALIASTVTSTVNGQAGQYSFNGVGPGQYIVYEVKQHGLLQTAPLPLGAFSVVALSGVNVTSQDFGNLGDANQSFVFQAYLDLLHRHVDPSGMLYFSGALDQGASRAQVVQGIQNSPEYRTDEVEGLYEAYLGRAADPTGLSNALNLLLNTPFVLGSQDAFLQLKADILGSAEYFQNHGGGTNAGFLAAIYHDVLGRNIDSGGAATFTAALASGVSRTLVAKAILSSVEAEQVLVANDYSAFLGRAADPLGMNVFVGHLQQGGLSQDIVLAMVASDEYFSRV